MPKTDFRKWYESTFVPADPGDKRYDIVDLREAFDAGGKIKQSEDRCSCGSTRRETDDCRCPDCGKSLELRPASGVSGLSDKDREEIKLQTYRLRQLASQPVRVGVSRKDQGYDIANAIDAVVNRTTQPEDDIFCDFHNEPMSECERHGVAGWDGPFEPILKGHTGANLKPGSYNSNICTEG